MLGINANGERVHDWLMAQGEEIVALITQSRELEEVTKLSPDVVISAGFRYIVPPEILEVPKNGCINLHKSYLPHNRGANPNIWTVMDGTPAGVSIHRMDEGIDTGPILAQRLVETTFSDTGKTLYEKLEAAQFALFTEFWPKFKAGTVKEIPQDDGGSSHQTADLKAIRKIDLDESYLASDLINRLKAMTFPPFNNCYVEIDGERYFLRIEITKGSFDSDTTDDSGTLRQYEET